MDKEQVQKLLDKYLEGVATPKEKAILDQLSNRVTKKRLQNFSEAELDSIGEEIYARLPQSANKSMVKRYTFIAVAATVLICFSIAFFFHNKHTNNLEQVADIAPGGNKAILTLANGKKIVLNDATTAQFASQAGISVSKTHKGELVYTVGQNTNMPIEYHTTETPRGGQYLIDLPDGTKVWLNASSSLKYPTRFTGKTRNVELTGEAYFEVTHNTAMPFKVKTHKQTVTVLGTHFNINAYHDEPVLKTTLLEGKVRINVIGNNASQILIPGQQAALNGTQIKVTESDMEQAVAWKNGYFRFRGESMKSVMRKLSRWYNIDVKYASEITDESYYGTISRNKNISQVLAVLTETGSVHFKLEGRSVIVMK